MNNLNHAEARIRTQVPPHQTSAEVKNIVKMLCPHSTWYHIDARLIVIDVFA